MSITTEQAQQMRDRVGRLAKERTGEKLAPSDFITLKEVKRRNSPPTTRSPKTGATVGAKAERASGAARAQPRRKKNPEYSIQKEYVKKMGQLHPEIIIFSDAAAHVAKSMIQQVRANALQSKGQKQPDTFIAQPSGDYAGLFLEFKTSSPYYKDRPHLLKKDKHVEDQEWTMFNLKQRGYQCFFVWSVEQAIELTEFYLNQ